MMGLPGQMVYGFWKKMRAVWDGDTARLEAVRGKVSGGNEVGDSPGNNRLMFGHGGMAQGAIGRNICKLALRLHKVKISAPDCNSTTFVGRFDRDVRVGPKRAKCSERSREIEMVNVMSVVFNEKIEG
eukprot:g24423.t1